MLSQRESDARSGGQHESMLGIETSLTSHQRADTSSLFLTLDIIDSIVFVNIGSILQNMKSNISEICFKSASTELA